MKTLSILIPSIESRRSMLSSLACDLIIQCGSIKSVASFIQDGCTILTMGFNNVEIIIAIDNCQLTIGAKRNLLLSLANNDVVVMVDDDDDVYPYFVKEILSAIQSDCDAVAINGIFTQDGGEPIKWFISKDNPYCDSVDGDGNKVFLRYQNHISPIKRSIAIQFKFQDIRFREDYNWATEIHNSGLIKTESTIEKPLYHYKYCSEK